MELAGYKSNEEKTNDIIVIIEKKCYLIFSPSIKKSINNNNCKIIRFFLSHNNI